MPDMSTDWTDPYGNPAPWQMRGQPPMQPGSSTLLDDNTGPPAYSSFWRTPYDDTSGVDLPQVGASGISGMGQTAQPSADMNSNGPGRGAANTLADRMPPPPGPSLPDSPAATMPQQPAAPVNLGGRMPPPPMPTAQRMPPPGVDYNPAIQKQVAIASGPVPKQIGQRDQDLAIDPATGKPYVNTDGQPTGQVKTGAKVESWLQRLGMAVLSATKLAPYAQQIIHPQWSQQMAQYEAAPKAAEELSQAQEAQQHGMWSEAQAEGMRQKPILMKDGSLYDPRTGQTVIPATTPLQKKQQALDAGSDEDTATAYALGLKPGDMERMQSVNYANLPPAIQGLYTPDPQGKVRVPVSTAEKIIERVAPTPTAQTTPLSPDRVAQFNQLLALRYKVLHPNDPILPAYQLTPGATEQDYQNVERSLAGEEGTLGTLANRAQTDALRQQTFELAEQAAADRQAKQGVGDRAAIAKIYATPMDSAERFNVMSKNYENAIKTNDQQAMLSLLYNHMGMTMGLQKGARMTQALIGEAIQSRPWLQGMQSKFDNQGYLTGVTLTPQQMGEMVSNARGRFSEDIQKARNEASYAGAQDDGPKRTPNVSVQNYYKSLAGGSAAKALQMLKQDGWSVD